MINQYLTLLVTELRENDVPDPLAQSFTLAAIWDDLCRLAGETPPPAVRRLFETDSPLTDPSIWGDRLIIDPVAPVPSA
jgi:hypothetical protein